METSTSDILGKRQSNKNEILYLPTYQLRSEWLVKDGELLSILEVQISVMPFYFLS